MSVPVRPYRRRRRRRVEPAVKDYEAEDVKLMIVTPPVEQPQPKPTLGQRVKKTLETPVHLKKRKRPKTPAEELADDADALADVVESMGEDGK